MRWYSGHWVVTNPGQGRIHGYNISQMDKLVSFLIERLIKITC